MRRTLSRNGTPREKKRKAGHDLRDSLLPGHSVPGARIAPAQGVCHHPAGMAPPRCGEAPFPGTAGLAGGPHDGTARRGLDLSVLALAADTATAVGHSRLCRTEGALGGAAGAALAAGAHRMAVATDIAANIAFVDRSRETAGGTHRHG